VLNVTATEADAPGFLRAQRTDAAAPATANGNYEPGVASGTLSIVPVAADGSIEIHTSAATHIVVDLVGAFTGDSAAVGTTGLFTPVTPARASDSRDGSGRLLDGETRAITMVATGSSRACRSDRGVGEPRLGRGCRRGLPHALAARRAASRRLEPQLPAIHADLERNARAARRRRSPRCLRATGPRMSSST
jgi:hypothetical protein